MHAKQKEMDNLEKALDVFYVLKIWQESVHKQLKYSLLKLRLGEKNNKKTAESV